MRDTSDMNGCVLHVITGLDRGGAERTLLRILEAESGSGQDPRHVVVSLSAQGAFADAFRTTGARIHELGMRAGVPAPAGWWRLVRIMRRERPDLVLAWLYHAQLLATLAWPLARRPRLIWNLRGTPHDPAGRSRRNRLVVGLLARSSRLPWAVAANSHRGQQAHAELGFHPRRWLHLPNGIDTDRWRPQCEDRAAVREAWGVDEATRILVMVARAAPQKDHATLLAALTRLATDNEPADRAAGRHPWHALLVGRDTDELALPAMLEDRVTALGDRSDVAWLLRGSDVAVLSSAYGEGLPNAVAEAMATGLPPVVTDVGDAGVLVGDTGTVVAPRDPAALAVALDGALRLPAADLAAQGRAARSRIETRYSLAASLAAYRALWADGPGADGHRDTIGGAGG